MRWKNCFSEKRLVPLSKLDLAQDENPFTARSAFQRDISRLIYSSAFRRMQGKTQVQTFPCSDYSRTRLTHSLEVATIGQIISSRVAKVLGLKEDLATLLYAAGLAHDIGNPPFGHFGEEVMAEWLSTSTIGQIYSTQINPEVRQDYQNFNGNSQGFRMLSCFRRQGLGIKLNLTVASLAAFTKYPFSARSKYCQPRKTGFFSSTKAAFKQVASKTGMKQIDDETWVRAPTSLLLEAADDISYLAVDIEDAYKSRQISFGDAVLVLSLLAEPEQSLPTRANRAVYLASLRSLAIAKMSEAVIKVFCSQKEKILAGEVIGNLLDATHLGAAANAVREFSKKNIYLTPYSEAQTKRKKILHQIMDKCGQVLLNEEKESPLYQKLVNLQPEPPQAAEAKLEAIYDYVAGMSDSYAYNFVRES